MGYAYHHGCTAESFVIWCKCTLLGLGWVGQGRDYEGEQKWGVVQAQVGVGRDKPYAINTCMLRFSVHRFVNRAGLRSGWDGVGVLCCEG